MNREDHHHGSQSQGVWQRNARQWAQVGAPLRPTASDGENMLALAAPALSRADSRATIAVLGLTPEIVQLAWPDDARLAAVDHSADMIATVWRPHAHVESHVMRARWEELPLASRSADVVAGDGSLNNLAVLDDYARVMNEIARVLKPGGAAVVRCFVRPDRTETLDAIESDARAGRIMSFHALKWRLAMVMVDAATASVVVSKIRDRFNALFPDRDELARLAHWERSAIDTIDSYQGLATRYTFPTLAQVKSAMAPLLRVTQQRTGDYELAGCCPTLLFEAAAPGA